MSRNLAQEFKRDVSFGILRIQFWHSSGRVTMPELLGHVLGPAVHGSAKSIALEKHYLLCSPITEIHNENGNILSVLGAFFQRLRLATATEMKT